MYQDIDLPLLRTFILLVAERNFTRVAERVGRTQPAISLQLRRLEEITGNRLFEPDIRPMRLTRHGEILLRYAREIIRLHDEARLRLTAEELSGRVALGCPDLYAASLLPQILAPFRRNYPNVEVNVRCALSMTLAAELDEGLLDLAVVTQMPGLSMRTSSATVLRDEDLVWLGAQDGVAWRTDPVPLAMLPEGNLYRDFAFDALNSMGREWRIACTSESVTGLIAMALADAAVTVLGRSVSHEGLRILGGDEGVPALPRVTLLLLRCERNISPAAIQLSEHISQQLIV